MASFENIAVDQSPPHDVYFETDVMYVLDDGQLLPVRQCAAWCRGCDTLVSAEYIPSVAELELLVTELDRPGNKYLAAFGRSNVDEMRREVMLRIIWRHSRISSAKCLDCGMTDIFPILEDACTDPVTGRRFRKCGWGFAQMAFHEFIRLSPEGMILSSNLAEVKDAVSRLLANEAASTPALGRMNRPYRGGIIFPLRPGGG
jgi:hypothetical protein